MGRWRQQGEIHHYHQEFQGTRSYDNRKPQHPSWEPPRVPLWEKKFCISVGAVPWSKLLETKRSMHLYDNIVQWNDSAGEEAFHNAKNRYWAEINGLSCDISLPDPDIYIDQIDWNSNIDPELYLDLEKEPKILDETEKSKEVVILGDAVLNPSSYSCTGWGDAEEKFQKRVDGWENNDAPNDNGTKDNGWQDGWNKTQTWNQNHWGCNNDWDKNGAPNDSCTKDSSGWQDGWNESRTWNQLGCNNNGCFGNNGNREDTSRYMSRYKTTRLYHDEHPVNHQWQNGRRGKRADFAHDHPLPSNNRINSYQHVGHY